MDHVLARVPGPRVPWRAIAAVAALALLRIALVVAAVVGSRARLPNPMGPARNGDLAYGSNGDIYVRDALEAAPRLLIGEGFDDGSPSFTADGQRLLFLRTIERRTFLMTARADGTDVRRLVPEQVVDPRFATSADGSAMALINDIRGVPRLFVVPTDASRSPAEIELDGIQPMNVSFRSPGTTELLVRGLRRDGLVDFFLVTADGSSVRPLRMESRLAFGAEWDLSGPTWSPDGSVIAYNVVESDSGVTNFRVHLVTADGSRDRALPGPSDRNTMEGWPNWSPSGTQLIVHRWTWGKDGFGWLAVMPADGSAPARDIGPRIPGGEESGLTHLWSPDGTRVLMRAENTTQVFSIDPVTGQSVELPWNSDGIPEWQRLAP